MRWQKWFASAAKAGATVSLLVCLAAGSATAKDKDGDGRGSGGGRDGGGDGHRGGGPPAGVRGDSGQQMHSAPQNIPRSAPSQRDGAPNDGRQRQSFYRGPDGGTNDRSDADRGNVDGNNPERSRVNDFLSGKGTDHGDFRNRFTDRDQTDRNGESFRQNADQMRGFFRDRDHNDLPFRYGWWDNRRFDRWGGPWGYSWWRDRPWYWWTWATAPALDGFFGWGWNRPYYWDYGPNGYIYYQDNEFYRNGEPYMSADDYYRQSYDLAHSAPAANAAQGSAGDWMSLGVFALTPEGQQERDRMVQLAVSREGTLSGTYYNQSNDKAHPISGMVDRQTHRAAWFLADGTNDQMVFETSIDNLTEPQSTVMVHFGPDNAGVWQMVRLEQPEGSQNGAAGPQQPQTNGQTSSMP